MQESHLAHMLRQRADKYGQREVFRFKDKETYQSVPWTEFKDKAEAVSKFLLTQGMDVGDNVGIFSHNCPEWTISDLGILSIRAVVIPFYSTASYTQLEYIINETEMQVLFVGDQPQLELAIKALDQTESLKRVVTFFASSSDDKRVMSLQDIVANKYEEALNDTFSARLQQATIDDLATIIYTSGTTGEPKGVMLNHSNFMSSFRIHTQRLKLGEDDVSMCFLPLSHVFERTWTFFLLYCGGVNVYNANPRAIMDELPLVKPTVMCAVPRFFEKIQEGIHRTAAGWPKAQKAIFDWALAVGLKYIDYQKDAVKAPLQLRIQKGIADRLVMRKALSIFGGNIRYMPCAGSAMSTSLLRYFHAMGLFVNYGYGASETTATVSCLRTDTYDFDYTGSIMPEVEVKISDEKMILVKGDTVFKGYYKKPEETAKVLIDGWYHTGDQGSIPKPGALWMTERIKDIIKTSTGKYISPQKIELLLSQSELIEQLCVIGDNRKYLSALIVPVFSVLKKEVEKQESITDDQKALVQHELAVSCLQQSIDALQAHLPPHEHIVKFTLLDEPFSIDNAMLTNTLKVRRKQVNVEYADVIAEMY